VQSYFHLRRSPIMLNALSRAAIGALKAGKSNLTPKIVQNELPKAMVATTSTCKYDIPCGFFSYLTGRLSLGFSAVLSVFSVCQPMCSIGCSLLTRQNPCRVSAFGVYGYTSAIVMAPPAAATSIVLWLYLPPILLWFGC